jgi:hypothetical protein
MTRRYRDESHIEGDPFDDDAGSCGRAWALLCWAGLAAGAALAALFYVLA